MLDNSMVALMIMLLLCFVGMLVMFLFVIRSNLVLTSFVKELAHQEQLALGDIERHLMHISFKLRDQSELIEEIQDEEKNLLPLISSKSENSFSGMADRIKLSSPQSRSSDLHEGLPDLSLPNDKGMR